MAFMRDPFYILMQDGQVNIHNPRSGGSLTLAQEVFDEIVMMRYYNMTEVERREAIAHALESQFETGADGVRKASGESTVMERVHGSISIRNMPDV